MSVYVFDTDTLPGSTPPLAPLGALAQMLHNLAHRSLIDAKRRGNLGGCVSIPLEPENLLHRVRLIPQECINLISYQRRLRGRRFARCDLGRLITTTQPDPDGPGGANSPETNYAYDAAGRLAGVTDPLGKTTNYAYDLLDHRTSVLLPDPDGAGSLGRPETVTLYDAVGNLLSLTDPVGNVTSWQYDNLNRKVLETNELSQTRSYAYNAMSQLTQITDRLGRIRQFAYDELGRRTQELWLAGETTVNTIDYTLDTAGQLTAAGDVFSSYAFAYDGLGRATQIDVNNGGPLARLTQAFDANGNRTQLAAQLNVGSGWVNDFVTDSTFDPLNRLTRIQQQGASGDPVAEKRVDFAYNAVGQFTSVARYKALAGGSANEIVTTTYGYDNMGRLTDLTHAHSTTTIADYNWSFDAGSRVTQMAFTSLVGDDGTSNYAYDDTNQLTAADHDFQTDESYSFDENGNRTMTGYDTDANNQLASDGTFNFAYDAEGNRLTRTRISNSPADDKTVQYAWDHRNRLIQITYKNNSGIVTKQINYAYDLFNRRIKKEIDADGAGINAAALERYLYDGDHIVLAFDGDDDLTHRYLPGPIIDMILADEQFDAPLSIGDTQADPGDLWIALADNLGTTRDLIDANGSVLNHLTYNAFGQVTSETAPSVLYAFGYTGRERDPESDLQYNRNRYYDAASGIWISEDPIAFRAGDTNLSRYVLNAPLIFTDADGKWARPNGGPTVMENVPEDSPANHHPPVPPTAPGDRGWSFTNFWENAIVPFVQGTVDTLLEAGNATNGTALVTGVTWIYGASQNPEQAGQDVIDAVQGIGDLTAHTLTQTPIANPVTYAIRVCDAFDPIDVSHAARTRAGFYRDGIIEGVTIQAAISIELSLPPTRVAGLSPEEAAFIEFFQNPMRDPPPFILPHNPRIPRITPPEPNCDYFPPYPRPPFGPPPPPSPN